MKSIGMRAACMMAVTIACMCMANALAHADYDIGTTGYFRFGTGFAQNGEERACFKAPDTNWKYRYGNECDTWFEIGPHGTYRPQGEDGPSFFGRWWVGICAAEGRQRLWGYLDTTELYIQASNIAALGRQTKVWVGRKYYQRFQTHLNDFWWLMMLGDGVGFEDIDVSIGKVLYAYTRSSAEATVGGLRSETFQNNHDLRLYDLPVGLTDKGRLGLQVWFAHAPGNDGARTADGALDRSMIAVPTYGLSLAAWHREDWGVLSNMFSVQYGQGITRDNFAGASRDIAMTTSSDDAEDLFGARIVRVTDEVLLAPDPRWALSLMGVFQRQDGGDYDATDINWYSFGLRPVWFFRQHMRAVAEYGFDRTENDSGASGNLHKFTIAGEIAADYGFWNRPVLRAFVTAATWSEAFRGLVGTSGQNETTTCSTRTNCVTAGVQIEYWW